MLENMSEPANFKTPHYMFYENNRGFHYRTLESLYRELNDTDRNRPFEHTLTYCLLLILTLV